MQRVLEDITPGGSNGASNVQSRPLGADLVTFGMRKLINRNLSRKHPILWQLGDFESVGIGPKYLDFDVRPTVEYVRISTLQHILKQLGRHNQERVAHLK